MQETLYAFGLKVLEQAPPAALNQMVSARLLFQDMSRDSPSGLVPGIPQTVSPFHTVSWTMEKLGNSTDGWIVFTPAGFTSYAGLETPVTINVRPGPTVVDPYLSLRVTSTVQTDGGIQQQQALLVFFTTGIPGFQVNPLSAPPSLEPHALGRATIELTNAATLPRSFEFTEKSNPCGLGAPPPAPLLLLGRERRVINVTIQAPDRTSLLGDFCTVTFNVATTDNPNNPKAVSLSTRVVGLWVDPPVVFNFFLLVLLIVLLILFLKRRKEKLDEEILGKPQKPWTIPVEKVYLTHLKSRDERAWYVVRHFLMEEEYRSSLLWYKSYKKATKGSRKKERLVLKQEKAYQRWKAAWAKDIAKPVKKADKFEAKLQRKLDRKARRKVSKEVARWKALVAKLEAAAAKEHARALQKHEKAARKAEKKGLPAPPAPAEPKPDLPPEPQPTPLLLADHRWSKKAARFRRRMVKRQGNLEVQFERADARKLRKLERKVRKIARKLDDPEFIEEHPLLAKGAGPSQRPAKPAKA